MASESELAEYLAELAQRAPNPPPLGDVIEDAGRQRLGAYYLYGALIAGLIRDDELVPARWPAEVSESIEQLGLRRFAPRTERGLDAELTPAEQATRRSPGREFEFAQLTADLINAGAFGSVTGGGHVRVADASLAGDLELELVTGEDVVHRRKAKEQWELVAQQLAGAPAGEDLLASRKGVPESRLARMRRLKESGISHAISVSTTLAVHVHPVGAAAGVGTRLLRARIDTGRRNADSLRHLGRALRGLRAQAYGELKRRAVASARRDN